MPSRIVKDLEAILGLIPHVGHATRSIIASLEMLRDHVSQGRKLLPWRTPTERPVTGPCRPRDDREIIGAGRRRRRAVFEDGEDVAGVFSVA